MIARIDNYKNIYLIKETKEKSVDMFTLFSFVMNNKEVFTTFESGELTYYDNEMSLRLCFKKSEEEYGHVVYIDSEWIENFNSCGISTL